MSNEELAIKGINDADAMWQLYQNNIKAIYKICNKFKNEYTSLGDLMQEAYFALIIAVQAYNRNTEYKFLTYLIKALEWHFIRYTKRNNRKRELLTLDAPISNDGEDGVTKADMLPDETAVEEFERATERVSLSNVFKEVEKILTDYQIRENSTVPLYSYIAEHYINKLTNKQISKKYGVTHQYVASSIKKAFRILRKNKSIKAYYEDIIGYSMSRGSLTFFQTTGMSSVEWAVMKLDKNINQV